MFRAAIKYCQAYPWEAVQAFWLGAVVGACTIESPIPWMILIGAAMLGRLFHSMINGE